MTPIQDPTSLQWRTHSQPADKGKGAERADQQDNANSGSGDAGLGSSRYREPQMPERTYLGGRGLRACTRDLCAKCVTFVHDIGTLDFKGWESTRTPGYGRLESNISYSFRLGRSQDLNDSAKGGCKVCRAICVQKIKKFKKIRARSAGNESYRDALLSIELQNVPLTSAPVFGPSYKTREFKIRLNKLELGCSWELFDPRPFRGLHCTTTLRELPGPIAEGADERSVATLTREWMNDCHANHSRCQSLRSTPPTDTVLPTRVLWIPPEDNSDPVLLETKGLKGKYAALSHCWGISERLTLKTENLEAFKTRVPLSELALTFQHAIQFVRAIGISYLWIDCLAIVQDSPEDWAKESLRMTDVYADSAVCICAVSARDDNEGLFCPRWHHEGAEFEHPDLGRVGLRPQTIDHETSLRLGATESRAWTLQETVLSPAVLYLTSDIAYWRCVERSASESYPLQTPTLPSHVLTNQIPSHILLEGDARSAYLLWYRIIGEYTLRELSVPTDRAVAIAGLAAKFSAGLKIAYSYGLFEADLHRGLLWHKNEISRGCSDQGPNFQTYIERFEFQKLRRFPERQGPSWSWVSLIGRVTYDWGGQDMPFVTKVDWDYEADCRAQASERPDVLCVDGYLMQGICQMRTVESNRETSYVVFQRNHADDKATDVCGILDFDEEYETAPCYLVPVSAWSANWNNVKRFRGEAFAVGFYLILARCEPHLASASSASQDTVATYRRIGMGGSRIEKVDALFATAETAEQRQRLWLV